MVAPKGVLMGAIPVVVGVIIYSKAYAIAKRSEQLDALGSQTPITEVEPAAWNVMLTKGIAVMLVLLGGLLLFGALLG